MISQQLGYNVLNCVSDVNVSVASFIYNRLVEEFMIALDFSVASLVSSHSLLDVAHWLAVPRQVQESARLSSRPTQPGHPAVGRHNEYWRWFLPLLGKKLQVLRNSRPCFKDCWHTDLVARWLLTKPAIRPTSVVCLLDYPTWGLGTPFPAFFPPLSIHSLIFWSFLLFSFFHSLYLFFSIVNPFPFYQNCPTPFPGQRS